MKKSNILILSILIAVLFTACNGKKQTYDIGYRLEPGKTYSQTMKIDADMTMLMMGQTIDISTKVNVTYSFHIKDTLNGEINADMSFNAIEMEMSSPVGSYSISTEKESTSANGLMPVDLSPMLKAMKNSSFSVVLTKRGEVKSMVGYDQMIDNIIASMGFSQAEALEMKTNLQGTMSEETIKDQMKNIAIYPDSPVKEGDSWEMNFNIQDMETVTTYTLKSVTDSEATIVGKSEIKANQNGVSIKGNQTVTLIVDLNSGWIKSGEGEQTLKGSDRGSKIETSTKLTYSE